MNARKAERLRALILPALQGNDSPWAAEIRALLTPDVPLSWPFDNVPPAYGRAREEWPLRHLEVDPFQPTT